MARHSAAVRYEGNLKKSRRALGTRRCAVPAWHPYVAIRIWAHRRAPCRICLRARPLSGLRRRVHADYFCTSFVSLHVFGCWGSKRYSRRKGPTFPLALPILDLYAEWSSETLYGTFVQSWGSPLELWVCQTSGSRRFLMR